MTLVKPNFLIIGAQKAATSWLAQGIGQHPDGYMAPIKETEFFSREHHLEQGAFDAYLEKHFSGVTTEHAVGEATVSYMWNADTYPEWMRMRPKDFYPAIPSTIHKFLGADTRIVVSLRNPVERAISAHLHHLRNEVFPPETKLLDIGMYHGIVHLGFYGAHLREWVKHFPLEQMHILIYEDAVRDPEKTFRDLYTYLGIEPDFVPPVLEKIVLKGIARTRLGNTVYVPKENGASADDDASVEAMHMIVSEEDYETLTEIYSDDIASLTDLLQIDLMKKWDLAQSSWVSRKTGQ